MASHLLPKSWYKAFNVHLWRIDWNFSGSDVKIKWRPDDDELKAMGSAFQPRWKEFYQDRPDKAVAIFALSEGCAHYFALMAHACSRQPDTLGHS